MKQSSIAKYSPENLPVAAVVSKCLMGIHFSSFIWGVGSFGIILLCKNLFYYIVEMALHNKDIIRTLNLVMKPTKMWYFPVTIRLGWKGVMALWQILIGILVKSSIVQIVEYLKSSSQGTANETWPPFKRSLKLLISKRYLPILRIKSRVGKVWHFVSWICKY